MSQKRTRKRISRNGGKTVASDEAHARAERTMWRPAAYAAVAVALLAITSSALFWQLVGVAFGVISNFYTRVEDTTTFHARVVSSYFGAKIRGAKDLFPRLTLAWVWPGRNATSMQRLNPEPSGSSHTGDIAQQYATAQANLESLLASFEEQQSGNSNRHGHKKVPRSEILPQTKDEVLNELGIVLMKSGNKSAAISRWREAIEANPAAFRALLNLGKALHHGSSEESLERHEAISVLKKLSNLQSTCEPHRTVGKKEKQTSPSFCRAFLESKEEASDSIFEATRLLGQIYHHAEDSVVAESYLKRALKIKPWDQETQLLLATVYEELFFLVQARSFYQKCQRLGGSEARTTAGRPDRDAISMGQLCERRLKALDSKVAEMGQKSKATTPSTSTSPDTDTVN